MSLGKKTTTKKTETPKSGLTEGEQRIVSAFRSCAHVNGQRPLDMARCVNNLCDDLESDAKHTHGTTSAAA